MDPEYGASYRDLYERHWWWRAREKAILDVLERSSPPAGFGPILDVGCGDGLLFEQLGRFGVPQGIEADAALVSDFARARGRIRIGRFDHGFETDTHFGLILMLDVIEHLDDEAALRRAAELLEPNGLLLITVPAFSVLWTAHDDFNRHLRRYTVRSLSRAVESAGLEVRRARYLFQWLFPLKLLVRAKERFTAREPQMAAVPPTPLNRLYYGISRCEQTTWGRIPWPCGTSILAECSLPARALASVRQDP